MDPFTLIAVGGAILKFLLEYAAIMLIAWLAIEVCRAVGTYLREKKREIGILYKRHAIDELINATQDEDVRQDLRTIRERHMGLFVPLDVNDDAVEKDICSMKAHDFMRDDMSDKVVIADDDSSEALP